MFRFLSLLLLPLMLVGVNLDQALAQSTDESRTQRFMSFIDRNKNGVMEPAEFAQMPGRLKESLEAAGLDTSRSISQKEFEQILPKLMERMRSRRGSSGEEGQRRPMVFRSSSPSGSSGWVSQGGFDQREMRGRYGSFQSVKETRPTSSSSGKSSSSTKKETAKLERTTVDLSKDFIPHDTDQDGQIGLYEWRKNNPTKLNDFFTMDLNGDGFLTPREIKLSKEGKTQRSAASFMFALNRDQPTESRTDSGKSEASAKLSEPKKTTKEKTVPTKSTASSNDPINTQAKYFFKLLDRNKDNTVSAEEWKKSRSMRRLFEGANIDLSQSMSQAQFINHYVTIKKK